MERHYNLKAIQVGVNDRHFVISNPVLVAAGIDLTTLIPGGASD